MMMCRERMYIAYKAQTMAMKRLVLIILRKKKRVHRKSYYFYIGLVR